MTPGLGMGGFGTGVRALELLIWIIKTTEDAHHLKDECEKLKTAADSLHSCLKANPQGLEGVPASSSLITLLEDVSEFVSKCKQSNIWARAWEITWQKRFPAMVKEMTMWIAILNLEVSTTTRSELLGLLSNLNDLRSQQEVNTAAILNKLSILDEMKRIQDEKAAQELGIDFAEGNESLVIEKASEDLLVGKLKLQNSAAAQVDVVCELVNEELMRYGEKGPRHVLIYSRLSASTLVHPFYGIAQRFKRRWVVMKDLRKCLTIADTIKTSQMPASIAERLTLAYQIATTVDYLHSVEILVKKLSDKTILLSQTGDKITPYLTELEKARLFKENSTGELYDVRYEALEMQMRPKPPRSVYSDIWSLGIIIWTCFSGVIPFDFTDEATGETDIKKVREAITKNEMPWTSTENRDPYSDRIVKLVSSCCNTRPRTRPSATEVTSSLWDIMILVPLNGSLELSPGGDIKALVSDMLFQVNGVKAPITPEHQAVLRLLESQQDAVAAYLLGVAIWQKQMQPEDDIEELLMLASTETGLERRARSALVHLETAMRAKHKGAAKYLMLIHGQLAELYQEQARQYIKSQSLPKELM